MFPIERSGKGADPWCVVLDHPTGWVFGWNEPGRVMLEWANGVVATRTVPTDFLRYMDGGSNPSGECVIVGKGADDYGYAVKSWTLDHERLEKVFGDYPLGVFWDGARFVYVQVVSGTEYLYGTERRTIPLTSQGIRQLLPGGAIIWGDDTHVITIAGRGIHKYSRLGPNWVGQRNGPDHIDLYDGFQWWTPIRGIAQPPRIAYLSAMNRYGVCAGTNHGAVLTVGPPWPALLPDTTEPPPPPPPPPPNGEEPVPYQRQSPDYKQFVQQTADRYPELWEAARKRPDGSRDDRFIRRLAWDLHQVDPRVGLNGKRGGDSISTDALAYHNTTAANNAEVIDVISGSHQPQWADVTLHGVGKVITPTDPGGTSPPPPPPPDECEDLLAKANAALVACRTENESCRIEIERLLAEIDRLKNLPPPPPPPCQCQIEGSQFIVKLFGITCRPL